MDIKKTIKRLQSGYSSYFHPNLVVKSSPIAGKGVFAKAAIKKGEIINVFTGLIVTKEEYEKLLKLFGDTIEDYKTKLADNFYLISMVDDKTVLEDEDFINHSCNPNVGVRGQVMMAAMRDIKPGEEVTFDYAMTDNDPEDDFICKCGAKNCRKMVRGSDWKLPELQKRYRGYFSWYLQEKIDKLKK